MRKLQINFAIAFAASAVFLAQGETVPTKPQNPSGLPDARQIMESSIAATQRDWNGGRREKAHAAASLTLSR